MSDALYKKDLLRLAADAAGAGRLAQADASATAHNPACGDRVTVDVALENGRITALAHHTHGCVLTQASAAILGADAIGASPPFDTYTVFDGVAGYAGRHRCVMLPLEATLEAMDALERRPAKV